MTEFIVSVYEEGDIVGAEVKVSSGDSIDTIEIVDAEDLNALLTMIQNVSANYASKTYLDTTLANADLSKTINATKFDGHPSNYFATTQHEHNYAPISHSDTTGQYGIGTDSSYGHVKTINALTDNSYVSGRALSSYQGKLLNDKITATDAKADATQTETRQRGPYFLHDAVIQKGSTLVIECYNSDGSSFADGTTVNFRINGTTYPLTVTDGKISMQDLLLIQKQVLGYSNISQK